MEGTEAGWYRDPAPPNPAYPTTLRFWDGKGWTTKIKQAVLSGTATVEQAVLIQNAVRGHTPDGQALSGWWRRFFAVLIDGIITMVLTVVLGWSWIQEIGRGYSLYMTEVLNTPGRAAAGPAGDARLDDRADHVARHPRARPALRLRRELPQGLRRHAREVRPRHRGAAA